MEDSQHLSLDADVTTQCFEGGADRNASSGVSRSVSGGVYTRGGRVGIVQHRLMFQRLRHHHQCLTNCHCCAQKDVTVH